MSKILIFYSKTGAGHLRAAEALSEHLKLLDQTLQIQLIDGMATDNFGSKTHPEEVFYLFSSKLRFLYNFLYQSFDNKQGVFLIRLLFKLIFGSLVERKIKEFSPDLVVSTHPAIRAQVMVCVDLGKPHLLWFDQKADQIVVPDQVVADYGAKFLNRNKINILGYPLKADFKTPKKKHKISNTILILGGGAGVGSIEEQVRTLTNNFPEKKFIVVCGFNSRLKQELLSKNIANLEVLGFTDQLPWLVGDSDMVLTKAGPGSIVEAAILKTPLIITSWITWQEKENVEYVVNNNLGLYCPDVNNLPSSIEAVYRDYQKYSHGEIELAHGSDKIARFLVSLLPEINQGSKNIK